MPAQSPAGIESRRAPSPRLTAYERKARFVAWFKNRFFLRFHMAIILALTFLAGLAVTKLLLVEGNTNLAVRYGVAVLASYAAFLALLQLWLWYVERDEPADALDVADGMVDMATSAPSPSDGAAVHLQGGGGDDLSDLVPDLDEDFGFALLALVALVALGCLGGYLVYAAPTILAEAAFEGLLASSLIPATRRGEATGWVRGALRATAMPFALILMVAVGFGWVAGRACPEARRMVDVVACAGF
jgi:hypothetical protein